MVDNFNINNENIKDNYNKSLMDELFNSLGLDEDIDVQDIDYSYREDRRDLVFNSIHNYRQDFDEVLKNRIDKQISGYLEIFRTTLEDAYKDGKLVDTIVHLKKMIQEYEDSLNENHCSEIRVTPDLNIIFPEYNNFEINFSPITKAVYILFCKHQTINIKQLALYENELTQLLYKLSNTADLDSIHNTVKDLVNPESKSIYTHISRVKNTLTQVMGETIAKSYIIISDYHGSEIKYIPINNMPPAF
ncbi:hypothetical protein PG593_07540 [Riemerella anatipestifer]|uniref:hypothetical protein n=1 Tax=Riemerella anatipestifer TaxID=34085 RepID=UPI00285693B1|nr:hypothetical protein [Riemerella anatipestifer]MDR7830858.1 hypothetical protein [Riemerella anatipestifer]MDY3529630.1 hypothetical protein [Riemerella anatipestifer]